ncbi:MAG: thiamine phosphate synthase [Herminiimonas sp.]|nr:thiamine phosphate synthase [Herminiimonas sp.]
MKGLYLVTPDWDDTERLLEVTEAALEGGVTLLQYRHKTATPALRLAQANALLALCRRFDCPFIINDHVGLCLEIGADGVHVGGTDAPVAAVRAQIGPDLLLGASCYGDLALARTAHAGGASYVAYGGFYPSRVKKYPVTTDTGILAESRAAVPLPTVVIGGMTAENAAPLVAGGADMVAAISSVYLADDPRAAAAAFARLFPH